MTNEEKRKIFEGQVLKVGEALNKYLKEICEKLTPVLDVIAKAAAVCEANKIVLSKETDSQKTCKECCYYREEDGTAVCWRSPFGQQLHSNCACSLFEQAQDATEAAETHDFREGELIVYVNGETFQIGEIKRLCSDGAFVWYHEGDTASKTPFENMHKLQNAYCIKQTSLAKYRPRCESCKHFSICSAKTDIEATTDASKCNDYTEE